MAIYIAGIWIRRKSKGLQRFESRCSCFSNNRSISQAKNLKRVAGKDNEIGFEYVMVTSKFKLMSQK